MRNKALLGLVTSLCLCFNTHAATVESLRLQGTPTITNADDRTVGRMPDAVVELFQKKGGHILCVSSPLEKRYEAYDCTVYGLYHRPSHRIYIRNGAEFGGTLAHELGHFLYIETQPSWTKEMRETISRYGGDDPNEFFAQAYSVYCVNGTSGISDVDAVIAAVNMTAERINKW